MLAICTVAFFGHRQLDNLEKVERLLEKYVTDLLDKKEYVDFIVGRNGDFDYLVGSVITSIKKEYKHNNSLILVLPYTIAEYKRKYLESYYDEVEISSFAKGVYPKQAIEKRNKEMVDRANIVICYVTKKYGGAYTAVKYAYKQGKQVINLADET